MRRRTVLKAGIVGAVGAAIGRYQALRPSNSTVPAYEKNGKTLYVIGEVHHPENKRSAQRIRETGAEFASVEGLEGVVDEQMMAHIHEDIRYVEETIRMCKNQPSILAGGIDVAITENEVRALASHDRPFLGLSPGSYIARQMYGEVPLFGHEDLELYVAVMNADTYDDLVFLKEEMERKREGDITVVSIPEELVPRLDTLLTAVEDRMSILKNYVIDLNDRERRKIVVEKRSFIAVEKTLDHMEQQGYESGALVMGYAHILSIYEALESKGFQKVAE